jgi:hypothetical protein
VGLGRGGDHFIILKLGRRVLDKSRDEMAHRAVKRHAATWPMRPARRA